MSNMRKLDCEVERSGRFGSGNGNGRSGRGCFQHIFAQVLSYQIAHNRDVAYVFYVGAGTWVSWEALPQCLLFELSL